MKEEDTASQQGQKQEQYFYKDENGNIVPVSLEDIKHKNHLHRLSHHSSDGISADDPERVAKIKTVAQAEAERAQQEANGEHHHHHHHHHSDVGIVPDNPDKDYSSTHHHHHHHHSVGIEPANPSKEEHHHHHKDTTGEFRRAMTSHLARKKLMKKWGWRLLVAITICVVLAVIAVYWFDPDNLN